MIEMRDSLLNPFQYFFVTYRFTFIAFVFELIYKNKFENLPQNKQIGKTKIIWLSIFKMQAI